VIQVPLGVRSVEGTLILGVHGLQVDGNGNVIFAVTKLKVRHCVTFKVTDWHLSLDFQYCQIIFAIWTQILCE
jgi:hypothetical protein